MSGSVYRRALAGAQAVVVVALASSCSAVAGSPLVQQSSEAAQLSIRQVDASGVRLPFETKFPDRWNRANNGTSFEPCTGATASMLASVGVDPASVEDAAGTNGQTLRGCDWKYLDSSRAVRWGVSQIVGNSPSLEHDKNLKSTPSDVWLPDETIAGRTVGVHYTEGGYYCVTYVQSGGAAVDTLVSAIGVNRPPMSEICDRALAFTRATISKMPL